MKTISYDNLENELIDFIKSKDIDVLYLASSNFAQFFNADFPNIVISTLKKIMKDKTLIVPTFSFDFCDTGTYSVLNSSTFCGGVSQLFLKEKDVERTMFPPMHNVAVWGKLKPVLTQKNYTSSFGQNSLFEDLNSYKTAVLLIDCSFDDGVPFVHCLEDKYQSSYRYEKVFNGKIIDKNNNVVPYEFKRQMRKKGTVLSAEKLGKMFYSTKYVQTKNYQMSKFVLFDLQDFYKFFDPIFKQNPNIMEVKDGNNI